MKVQDEQNIWWDAFEKEIEILDKDIHGIGFLQKGYRLEIRSSHPATFVSKLINKITICVAEVLDGQIEANGSASLGRHQFPAIQRGKPI